MTNDKLLKVDYDLIYKKATLIQDTGVMNFDIFIEALFILSNKLHGGLTHESFLSTVRTGFSGVWVLTIIKKFEELDTSFINRWIPK